MRRGPGFFVLLLGIGLLVPIGAQPAAAADGFCNGLAVTIPIAAPGLTTYGTDGPDVIEGTDGVDIIHGGAGDDVICGEGGDDQIFGENGNDRIWGGSGNDYLHGGRDRDVIFGQAGDDEIHGGPGHDYDPLVDPGVNLQRYPDVLAAGGLNGGSGNDTIFGEGGKDILIAGKGQDYLDGGPQNDRLFGSNDGGETLLGGDANDTVKARGGNGDVVDGGDGTDLLIGSGGTQTCMNGPVFKSCDLPESRVVLDGAPADLVAAMEQLAAWIADPTRPQPPMDAGLAAWIQTAKAKDRATPMEFNASWAIVANSPRTAVVHQQFCKRRTFCGGLDVLIWHDDDTGGGWELTDARLDRFFLGTWGDPDPYRVCTWAENLDECAGYPGEQPANDQFEAAIPAGNAPWSHTIVTSAATVEPSEPDGCGAAVGATVWYEVTTAEPTLVAVDTVGSDFDTVLSVYTGSGPGDLTMVTCQDDIEVAVDMRSVVGFDAEPGTSYWVQAGGFSGLSGTLQLNVNGAVLPERDDEEPSGPFFLIDPTTDLDVGGDFFEGWIDPSDFAGPGGIAAAGEIVPGDLHDHWYFEAAAGREIEFFQFARCWPQLPFCDPPPLDPMLRIRDGFTGALLDIDDDSGANFNAQLTFRAPYSGIFYVDAGTARTQWTGPYELGVRYEPNLQPTVVLPDPDKDRDGLDDAWETEMARRYQPYIIYDELEDDMCVDPKSDVQMLYQVTPLGIDDLSPLGVGTAQLDSWWTDEQRFLLITYVRIYPDDCGIKDTWFSQWLQQNIAHSHPGDTEATYLLLAQVPPFRPAPGVVVVGGGDWRPTYLVIKHHFDAPYGLLLHHGVNPTWDQTHPVLYSSLSKHATFESWDACEDYKKTVHIPNLGIPIPYTHEFEYCGGLGPIQFELPYSHNVGETNNAGDHDIRRFNLLSASGSSLLRDFGEGGDEYAWADDKFCGGYANDFMICGGGLRGKWWPQAADSELTTAIVDRVNEILHFPHHCRNLAITCDLWDEWDSFG